MTNQDWEALIEQTPDDVPTRLAYSDFLEENGELIKAKAIRFIIKRKYRPLDFSFTSVPSYDGWLWVHKRKWAQIIYHKQIFESLDTLINKYSRHILPIYIYKELLYWNNNTRKEAEKVLLEAIIRLIEKGKIK